MVNKEEREIFTVDECDSCGAVPTIDEAGTSWCACGPTPWEGPQPQSAMDRYDNGEQE